MHTPSPAPKPKTSTHAGSVPWNGSMLIGIMRSMITLIGLIVMLLTVAAIANDTARCYVLGVLFGDTEPMPLSIDCPADVAVEYSDNTYQVFYAGYSVIEYLSAARARNLVAFGHCVAYVV